MKNIFAVILLFVSILAFSQRRNPELTQRIAGFKRPAQKTSQEVQLTKQRSLNKTNTSLYTSSIPSNIKFPGEFEESQAVCISWSYDYDNNGIPTIVDTSSEYGWVSEQLANAIQPECPVWIRVKSKNDTVILKRYMKSQATPLYNYKFIICPMDDWWMRDYGPIGIYHGAADSLAFLDLKYYDGRDYDNDFPKYLADSMHIVSYETQLNAEGGNIMTDGWGKLFFSDVITSTNTDISIHNPAWTTNNTLDSCKKYFGSPTLIETKTLHCDGGTGHIDLYLKMIDDEHMMVMQMPSEVTAVDRQLIEDNLQTIKGYSTQYNRPFKIYRIPTPTDNAGNIVKTCTKINNDARTYINGITVNKTFIYPKYSDAIDGNVAQDAAAEAYIKKIMPGYKVIGIDSRVICANGGGGELHCITMQIPAENPLRIWHPSIEGYVPLQSKYHIIAKASNRSGIASTKCYWRKKGGATFNTLSLTDSAGYAIGDIQDNTINTSDEIQYYIGATSNNGKIAVRPIVAPQGYYSFYFTQGVGFTSEEIELTNHLFEISPNPTSNNANLQFQLLEESNVKFIITDITGKIIQTIESHNNAGISCLKIQVSGYSTGMYFCTMTVNEISTITRRFIVN